MFPYVLLILLGLTVLAITFVLLLSKISPDTFCRLFRSVEKKPESAMTSRTDGVMVKKNIVYKSRYPNNQLDIYMSRKNKGTIFHLHGGGYIIGDKESPDATSYLEQWLEKGYNLIRVNYALAPEYRYPTAILQVFEAWCFVVKTIAQYDFNPNNIVLMGNSAGAQLAGQLGLILTDSCYAKQMGISPEKIPPVRPLAFISTSGLLDMPKFGETDSMIMNFIFEPMAVSTFNDRHYAAGKAAKEASILENVSANFLPTFLSDGNTGSFTNQAKELETKLHELGVPVASHFPETADGKAGHDCELNIQTNLAQSVFTKQLAFVDSLLK